MFKVVRNQITNEPIYLTYKNQPILNLSDCSIVNGIFIDAIVALLNREACSMGKFEDTLTHYKENRRALMQFTTDLHEDS